MMPPHLRYVATAQPFPADLLATLPDQTERDRVAEVSARPDTAALIVTNCETGEVFAYAVYGNDGGGMLAIYAARVVGGGPATKLMFRGLLGASEVLGKPLRVHSDNVQAMARMMGAGDVLEAIDGDGVNMAVFEHG